MDEQHLDERFDRFRAGPPLAVPAGASAARHAFRHRRRVRTAASCALAAVAVGLPSVAFAAGAFDRHPSPPVVTTAPTPDRTTTPSRPPTTGAPAPTAPTSTPPAKPTEPTGVPTAAMLTERDLPGYQRRIGKIDGDWTFASTTIYCTGPGPDDPHPRGTAEREADFSAGPEEGVAQQVVRMRSTTAAREWIDGLPDRLGTGCGGVTYAIAASDFAGDGSIIVRVRIDGEQNHYLFVRQGPLITQVWWDGADVAELRDLGRAAADRLCAGTTAC